MENEKQIDWSETAIHFIITTILAWPFLAAIFWRFSPYSESRTIFMVSLLCAVIAGLVAALSGKRFWLVVSAALGILKPGGRR